MRVCGRDGVGCLRAWAARSGQQSTHSSHLFSPTEEAKQRPGVDFFPTDKTMLPEYVRRTPDTVLEVLSS